MPSLCMIKLDHSQSSRQGRQSPHSGGQLYHILTRFNTFRLSYFRPHKKCLRINIMPVTKKWKLQWWRGSEFLKSYYFLAPYCTEIYMCVCVCVMNIFLNLHITLIVISSPLFLLKFLWWELTHGQVFGIFYLNRNLFATTRYLEIFY